MVDFGGGGGGGGVCSTTACSVGFCGAPISILFPHITLTDFFGLSFVSATGFLSIVVFALLVVSLLVVSLLVVSLLVSLLDCLC